MKNECLSYVRNVEASCNILQLSSAQYYAPGCVLGVSEDVAIPMSQCLHDSMCQKGASYFDLCFQMGK